MAWSTPPFWKAVAQAATEADATAEAATRFKLAATAPVIWLLGKTGSGKTSIVAALTRDPRATIGQGFKPCTASSLIYDWPDDGPVLRFLDTRGVGEAGYDPTDDMAFAEGQAHILLITMRAADPAQRELLSALKSISTKYPRLPLIVAQTSLHELYPRGAGHPTEYPYSGDERDFEAPAAPAELRRALQYQRALFTSLNGSPPIFVPLDFALPEDGFTPVAFGLEALRSALEAAGLHVLQAIEQDRAAEVNDEIETKAHPLILGYAAAAAASGTAPLPGVGVGALVTIIGMMLRALAKRYHIGWNSARFKEFATAIGAGAMLGFGIRYGLRELLKLVPVAGAFVGGALNAASASALVYATGRAACVYLGALRKGKSAQNHEIQRVFKKALSDALAKTQPGRPFRSHSVESDVS